MSGAAKLERESYRQALRELHIELVRWQGFVKQHGTRVFIIVEGRDAAGKGGLIKTLVEPLNPRGCRVVALDRATERERGQWYFQRYLAHLPAAGEIVVFDRSWYNRVGLEVVMGYCTQAESEALLAAAPALERMLVEDGILVRKLYLEVSKAEQARRLAERARDPLEHWKLSPLDLAAQARWDDYSAAAETMFARTATAQVPWVLVAADDRRRARLNAIRYLLASFPHADQLESGRRDALLTLDPGVVRVLGGPA
ncbi:MAG: polyphosphate kinase 2 [Deltaproteobacteria bacterium]|nr:polyphosphate kinase 2 [Deltaproteobacteria bacterium]